MQFAFLTCGYFEYDTLYIKGRTNIGLPLGPINNISGIGSDNGLVPIRRQAIIWTSDD